MAHYTASVRWQLEDGNFSQRRYSRRHQWQFDGGVSVAALSSCHMLWFLDLAARAGWAIESYDDEASGVMAADTQGRQVMTEVTLRPVVRLAAGCERDQTALIALHHQAHEACFLANSVHTRIHCEPRFAGPPA
jgi:organic hydroperoxide reductase OsmC/OhrA